MRPSHMTWIEEIDIGSPVSATKVLLWAAGWYPSFILVNVNCQPPTLMSWQNKNILVTLETPSVASLPVCTNKLLI